MKYGYKGGIKSGLAIAAFWGVCGAHVSWGITDISDGYTTPETISPTGTGPYLIADANAGSTGVVRQMASSGGTPTIFANEPANTFAESGLFLPANFSSSVAGEYATFGSAIVPGTPGLIPTDTAAPIYTYSSSGVPSLFTSIPAQTSADSIGLQQAITVSSFGAYSGDVLVTTNENPSLGRVVAVSPTGTTSTVATLPFLSGSTEGQGPSGIVQAPAGFGSFGGDLLVSDPLSGVIDAVTPAGTILPFTTIPLLAGETGLRQLEFSPADFFSGQENDLIVSISGSLTGGGPFGELVALNGAGDIVESINEGTLTAPFDPRGAYFINGNQLLVANTDPSIDLITVQDFVAGRSIPPEVPEPTSLSLLAFGGLGLLARRRK